ncbi:S-layer homology domain-containing protein [Anoxybacillus flavithermus]|uniref:S-layer homology domain-containing protein n=2 Tax=Anoxybacillus flavithermus TaxID=33934 RepID=UPI0018680749|nr:S-layer homology domain-containing protein [Anoxybacillus flavithermus]MBE2940090.1 S-layer homology domain-containing protein [Anoxybacillus flavithermus]MBE2942843.1 S-layer homology domain-containing protein [Anoxybacillus flavithermus]MBE2951171.1 S-layer homology domain-containing protein [Anoxybacillus flavithermus]MBE2953831.1 S-layer homology domain-containing protein [Anoxybacillus flavithermus]MBE2959058.1 S-layer homology domain-containing protein [Anoxybacillus flavithermus]
MSMAYQPKSYRKFLAGTVSAAVVASAIAPVASASFTDVAGSVHADDIATLVAKGYIKGYADGTFKPNKPLTRGEAAIIFSRILKDAGVKAPEQGAGFPDVPASKAELAEAVAIVKAAGVMGGDEKGNFNPNANITREQMAKVVVEAFKLTKPANYTTKITDLDKAGSWAREYIQTLEANGVTKNTEFAPKQNVTRGQFASFVVRAMDVKKEVSAADITAVKLVDEKTLEVTFNGELKEVKKEDFAIQGVEIESVSIKAAAAAEAKTTVVVIKTKTALEEGKSYNVSYKGQTTDKAKVDVPVVTPKVESVSAINAKQIEIKFNKAVDTSTATNKSNYKIQRNADPSASTLATLDGTASVSVSSDGKTVTITTTGEVNSQFGVTTGTPFKFIVENVKAKDGKEFEKYTTNLIVEDKVAPTLKEVKATAKNTTTRVTLVFSEPVQTTGAIAYVGGQAASVQNGSSPNELVLTTAQSLEAGKSYEVTLLNFKDYANNFLQQNPTTTSFTVTTDVVAPTVQDVKVVRDNLIEVTFDKAMDVSTFAGHARVLDLNGIQRDGGITATVKPGTSGKTIRLALTATVPFNENGTFAGTLVLGDGIKDVNGNAKVATSHSVTIAKDTVRPTVAGTTYVPAGGQYAGSTYVHGAVVVKFSEEVALTTGTDIKLITSSGVDETLSKLNISGRAVNSDNNTEVIIPLSNTLSAGTYTLRIGNDVVRDLSTQLNKNTATVTTVNVSASSDINKPVVNVSGVSVVVPTDQTTGTTITLNMTDDIGLDLATVQNVTNYLLDGKPLPSGSYVTISHNSGSSDSSATNINVTLHIPAKSVTKDATYALNINNIKDKAGNIADPKVASVTLRDDVSPELKSAKISSNGLLVLEFTENVSVATAATLSDFQFTINGTEVDVVRNSNIASIADGTGTDSGKYVVTFTAKVDAGADGNAVTTADNRLYLDVNGNNVFDAGDILIQTGTTTSIGSTTLDLNLLSALKVKVANNTVVKDRSTLQNPIVVGTSVTVK